MYTVEMFENKMKVVDALLELAVDKTEFFREVQFHLYEAVETALYVIIHDKEGILPCVPGVKDLMLRVQSYEDEDIKYPEMVTLLDFADYIDSWGRDYKDRVQSLAPLWLSDTLKIRSYIIRALNHSYEKLECVPPISYPVWWASLSEFEKGILWREFTEVYSACTNGNFLSVRHYLDWFMTSKRYSAWRGRR